MNMHEAHPDSEQLDRLRAGLLDDEHALKTGIESHLADCEACRKRYDWSGHLKPGGLPLDAPVEQLANLREQAINAPAPPRRLLPLAVAAALALVAVVLVKPALQDQPARTQLAQTPTETTPVLYEDLDFYLWLTDHKDNADSTT